MNNRPVSRLTETIAQLRAADEMMPIQTAHLFFLIAERPALTQKDLMDATGLSQPAVFRNTSLLGEGLNKREGMKLVERIADPTEGRRHIFFLTEKGRTLMKSILRLTETEETIEKMKMPTAREFLNRGGRL